MKNLPEPGQRDNRQDIHQLRRQPGDETQSERMKERAGRGRDDVEGTDEEA